MTIQQYKLVLIPISEEIKLSLFQEYSAFEKEQNIEVSLNKLSPNRPYFTLIHYEIQANSPCFFHPKKNIDFSDYLERLESKTYNLNLDEIDIALDNSSNKEVFQGAIWHEVLLNFNKNPAMLKLKQIIINNVRNMGIDIKVLSASNDAIIKVSLKKHIRDSCPNNRRKEYLSEPESIPCELLLIQTTSDGCIIKAINPIEMRVQNNSALSCNP